MDSSDALSICLDALRLSGSLVLNHTYQSPWRVDIPASTELGRMLGAESDARVIAFHYAERGEFWLDVDRDHSIDAIATPLCIGPGELAVCFGGRRHAIRRGDPAHGVGIDAIIKGEDSPPLGEAGPGTTKLLCGVFMLRDATLNPLLAALPEVAHARPADGDLDAVVRTLQRERRSSSPGSSFIVARTLEILCAQLIRDRLNVETDDSVGLFRLLRDPRLARSLEGFHRDPAAPWTVVKLAKVAGLSRSRFSHQFAEMGGEGPMTYVTRWRINLATRLLRATDLSVAEIATRVGYQGSPAFSRVYKRYTGVSPAQHRRGSRSHSDVT